ncbi:hypothetical protein STAQ_27250 [Allostella sp. ATCC 35155]|nr:hypothetical protein STAQ_27250 [Stella sp. ATCC 35155]
MNADGWTPGAYVRHPEEPDWGLGQVQSAIGDRVTVNFQHRGKVLIDTSVVRLAAADPEEPEA